MSRIGYTNEYTKRRYYYGADPRLTNMLKLPGNRIGDLYMEIDRTESTNESIKALVIKCFTENPINETSYSSSP